MNVFAAFIRAGALAATVSYIIAASHLASMLTSVPQIVGGAM